MSEPLVSFLSTAYRTEQYVPGMIESLLAQTDGDWELVVVDNGRVDAMAEVIGRYTHDPRIRMVRQENRGVIGGFQAATPLATGRFVTPLSSDDEIVPEYVERMREALVEHPEAVGVMSDAHLFSDDHEGSYQRGLARSMGAAPASGGGEWLTRADLFAGRIPYYCGVFRRDIWQELDGYSTRDDTVDEVIDLLFQVLDRGPVFVLPERLGRYRLRDDSVTRDASSVEAFERRIINSYHFYAERGTREERAQARRTTDRLLYLQALRRAREAFARRDMETARRESASAWRHHRTARSLTVMLLLRLAPGLLAVLHPLKQRFSDWMLVHSPVDRIRARTRTVAGSPRVVSRLSKPDAAAPGTAPRAGPSGRPPTSA